MTTNAEQGTLIVWDCEPIFTFLFKLITFLSKIQIFYKYLYLDLKTLQIKSLLVSFHTMFMMIKTFL